MPFPQSGSSRSRRPSTSPRIPHARIRPPDRPSPSKRPHRLTPCSPPRPRSSSPQSSSSAVLPHQDQRQCPRIAMVVPRPSYSGLLSINDSAWISDFGTAAVQSSEASGSTIARARGGRERKEFFLGERCTCARSLGDGDDSDSDDDGELQSMFLFPFPAKSQREREGHSCVSFCGWTRRGGTLP